jgi:thiol-disulfide isomerase/thioredoxin
MKKIVFYLFVLGAVSIKAQTNQPTAELDDDGNLVGIANQENFYVEPFSEWFDVYYEEYTVNNTVIEALKPLLNNIKIKAFMGTWCEDSHQQTPAFYKILDAVNFDDQNLVLTCLNREKKTPDNLQEGFNIERVPTFIFYKDGKELGRIVEYPRESLEEDMLKIMSGEPYKHSYEE